MRVDQSLVGAGAGPVTVSWTESDVMLYALAVGAGEASAVRELEFTTENTPGKPLRVLPTFAIGLMQYHGPTIRFGPADNSRRLHAGQRVTVHRELPAAGAAEVSRTVSAVMDKGADALVITDSELRGPAGELIATSQTTSFVRGAGGFGGDRGADLFARVPDREPDRTLTVATQLNQALLYRLCGDRNPLHSDPAVAATGGFSRPILHGLCTFGTAARVLLHDVCAGDPGRFETMSGRFTRPVLPGETLLVAVWANDGGAQFQVRLESGEVVLDRGALGVRQPLTGAGGDRG